MRPNPTQRTTGLGNAESRRNRLLQERALQLVIQYQIVSPENVCVCVHVCLYMYATIYKQY